MQESSDTLMIRKNYTVSESTNLEPLVLIETIKYTLVNSGYTITTQKEDLIAFENSPWQIGSRTKGFQKVDGGMFQIFRLQNETKVILTYYASFGVLIPFGVFVALSIFSVGYYAIFFTLVFALMFLLRLDNVQSLGKKLLRDALS